MCVIYFFAGARKLSGTTWWDGTAMWLSLANYEYQTIDMTWLAYWPLTVAFLTNLTVHTSKLNRTNKSRWSIDFRNHATPEAKSLSDTERAAAEYLNDKARSNGWEPLTVLTDGHKPSWEEWFNAKKQLN